MNRLTRLLLIAALCFAIAKPVLSLSEVVPPSEAPKPGEPIKKEKVVLAKAPKFFLGAWLNSQPRTLKNFEDRVTLLYFWDYTSINCVRELEVLKKLDALYHRFGFQVILVHSPEFEFAKKEGNVKSAIDRLQLHFPVFLDNDFKLWDGYKVHSWPTKILVDPHGRIVNTFVGEGKFAETEFQLRTQLREMNPGAVLPEQPAVEVERHSYSVDQCGMMTAETYTGYNKASWWGAKVANRQWVAPDKISNFKDYGERPDKGFFVEGVWANNPDSFDHARNTEKLTDYLGVIYAASEVYTVASLGKDAAASRVYVVRDGESVPEEFRGKDIYVDSEGRTYFTANEARLYYLIANEDDELHELKLYVQTSGVGIHSFSFSNHCLSEFDHL